MVFTSELFPAYKKNLSYSLILCLVKLILNWRELKVLYKFPEVKVMTAKDHGLLYENHRALIFDIL